VYEAEQFQSWERWAIELEDALIAHAEAPLLARDEATARWRAVVAAAALGLYVEGPQYRVAYASIVAADLKASPPPAAVQSTKPASSEKGADKSPPVPTVTDAPRTLDALLRTRGQRLI